MMDWDQVDLVVFEEKPESEHGFAQDINNRARKDLAAFVEDVCRLRKRPDDGIGKPEYQGIYGQGKIEMIHANRMCLG